MSEAVSRQQAGAMLEAARKERGIDLGALAAQMKVPLARLQALEAGEWQQLPSGPYARGLATAVCRALQIDAASVLSSMPGAQGAALDRVAQGINQPFRGEHRRSAMASPWLWLGLVLTAVAIAALLWLPQPPWDWLQVAERVTSEADQPADPAAARGPLGDPSNPSATVQPALAASAAVALPSASPAASQASTVPTANLTAASTPAPGVAAAMAEVTLRITAQEASWVSITDARGQTLVSRLVAPGEAVELAPQVPVRLILGNAPGVRLEWRGQPRDLSAYANQRVARLELQ
jgi:cytoskeleton protein RodZ